MKRADYRCERHFHDFHDSRAAFPRHASVTVTLLTLAAHTQTKRLHFNFFFALNCSAHLVLKSQHLSQDQLQQFPRPVMVLSASAATSVTLPSETETASSRHLKTVTDSPSGPAPQYTNQSLLLLSPPKTLARGPRLIVNFDGSSFTSPLHVSVRFFIQTLHTVAPLGGADPGLRNLTKKS